ncbi:MAG: mycothiol conjugate amidase Mca [Actinomycetota bacterium]|nr:mycothiol conjugate amidase Mca [Actinomycetota bacterium]
MAWEQGEAPGGSPGSDQRLCLLSVHAHPDDESSKGAGTVARYHREGVHTVLVCCTGGEEGDILNPAMDRPEVRENLHRVRMEELAQATTIIGYDEVAMLGYRDSGMPDTPANQRPDCFARADLDEAVGRLVREIRRTRPQVVITYNDDQKGYPHPDHLRVHDLSVVAFDRAGDPDAYPDQGPPWQPSKLYYSVWSRARMLAIHEKFLELGLESPFDERWTKRPSQDDRITTRIHIAEYDDVRRQALLAHATQIDPTSPFWFGLPPEVARTVHPYEDYVLARTLVETSLPEDDLFAGLRSSAGPAAPMGAPLDSPLSERR